MTEGMAEGGATVFEIELNHLSWEHLGWERRGAMQPHELSALMLRQQRDGAADSLLKDFAAVARPIADACDLGFRDITHESSRHYFDGGYDITTAAHAVATCAAAIPLAAVISACKTILVRWIDMKLSPIRIKLRDGRKFEVRSVKELEQVLSLLDESNRQPEKAKRPNVNRKHGATTEHGLQHHEGDTGISGPVQKSCRPCGNAPSR
jgi:hypothetical protein